MKYVYLFLVVFVSLSVTSCKEHCADCQCTGSNIFEFSDSIAPADTTAIRAAYTQDFPADDAQEICAKKKEIDQDIKDYEGQSKHFEENQNVQGNPWSIVADYTCTCTKIED